MVNLQNHKNGKHGKVLFGIILIGIGCLLLLTQFGVYYPSWLFSWPMLLIIIGFYIGSKHGFKSSAPFILIGIGSIFLLKKCLDLDVEIVWPIILIAVGIWMIFFRKSQRCLHRDKFDWDKRFNFQDRSTSEFETPPVDPSFQSSYSDDIIDCTSIFGGVKKNIFSKDFKGGDVVNFFGGAEINLIHADIKTEAVLDVTQVFGGIKIIVPANWIVKSEMVAIFGGIEDRRPSYNQDQAQKVLIIQGTSIFAGIDIKSY